jgi:hypothetical protein
VQLLHQEAHQDINQDNMTVLANGFTNDFAEVGPPTFLLTYTKGKLDTVLVGVQ